MNSFVVERSDPKQQSALEIKPQTLTITKTETGETRPLISVIVPVYNVAPYLRRCIDSLLAQTFRDFELILVDDGSTDGSADICDDYMRNFPSPLPSGEQSEIAIRVIHQPNAGVSAARNRGIDEARGEYVSFVDADDWVEPSFLQAFADEVRNNRGVDCVVQGFYDRDGSIVSAASCACQSRKEIDAKLPELEKQRQIGYIWNKLYRRRLISDSGLSFDTCLPIGEDAIFGLSFILKCDTLRVSSISGYHYNEPAIKREYPYQPFDAWERRLDAFETVASNYSDRAVIEFFRARDFNLSLFVLGIAYYVGIKRQKRILFIRKIRAKGRLCRQAIRRQEGISGWLLTHLVLNAPASITDAILSLRHLKA